MYSFLKPSGKTAISTLYRKTRVIIVTLRVKVENGPDPAARDQFCSFCAPKSALVFHYMSYKASSCSMRCSSPCFPADLNHPLSSECRGTIVLHYQRESICCRPDLAMAHVLRYVQDRKTLRVSDNSLAQEHRQASLADGVQILHWNSFTAESLLDLFTTFAARNFTTFEPQISHHHL